MIGADRACQICTRLVCETCGADWTTCSAPSGRVIRLGLTARVRDVDPFGRFALVSHWRKPLRIFDLRQLRWIDDIHIPRSAWLLNRRNPPRLDSQARLTYADWDATTGDSASFGFVGLKRLDLRSRATGLVLTDPVERGTAMTATDDTFYFVSAGEQVVTVAGGDISVFDPLPRRVIQAVHLNAERKLLATASWSELALHRIVDGTLERIGHRTTETNGDVTFIAVGGPWLVAAIQRFAGTTVFEVYHLATDDSLGALADLPLTGNVTCAALSRDGRYLAVAIDGVLHVRELATDRFTRFEDHTDRINLVRFAADDHLLITADTDNRVVLRPRTSTTYALPLVTIDVPDVGVPLPQQTRVAST
jgi:hypothetical protein